MNSTDQSRESVFNNAPALNLTPRQATVVLPSLLAFLNVHSTKVGDILIGGLGKWTNKDLRELERVITQKATSSERAADYLRVLRKACAFWAAREELDVGYPRIPTLLVHPPNPFRGNFAKLLRTYDLWKRVLDLWLVALSNCDSKPNEASAGLAIDALVLSSILYGGLHTRSSVSAMLRALEDAKDRTLCVDGRMHIELSLSWSGIPDIEFRRWQPDALTATLWAAMPDGAIRVMQEPRFELLQLSALADVELNKKVKERIEGRLKQMSGLAEAPRGGLNRLLQAANLAAYTEIPAILAAYAGRKLISHSLKRRAFERLSSEKSCAPDKQSSATERITNINVVDSAILRTPSDLEPEWLKAVRAALSAEAADEVREAMNRLAGETAGPSFVGRLADFLGWLLNVRTPSSKPRTLSSAKRTVIELARSMGPLLETPDPMDLDSASREELYSRMIEGTGLLPSDTGTGNSTKVPPVSKRRRNLSRALFEFERYLNSKGKERIEDESIFCGRFGLSSVDANLVTFEEYDAALKEVDKVWPPSEYEKLNRIAKILLCLGFRCGLRRREALHCMTDDIGPAPDYEFIVRPSEFRKLKSRSARRRIPLIHYLPRKEGQNELGLVLDWQEQRRSDPEASPFLLGISKEVEVVPESIFEELNGILRRVTNDEGVHYHHLRHSQAGFNWLRLMIANLPYTDLFPHLKQTSEWLREGPEFREKIYGPSGGGVTRKHAYFAAQQLGHLSPSTSLQTYIHFADYLLAFFLSRSGRMSATKEQVLMASRKSRQTAERVGFDENHLLALPVALWKGPLRQEEPDQIPTDDTSAAGVGWARCVYEFLHELERGVSIEKSAALHHLELDIANKIQSGMKDLGFERSEAGPWLRKKGRASEKTERLRWPTDPFDLAIIRHFEETLAGLAGTGAEITAAAIRCYQAYVWNRKPIVVFHDLCEGEKAFDFVQFLGRLGIKRKNIRWFMSVEGERSSYRAQWKKKLKFNPDDNKIEKMLSRGGEKWFGIMPRLEEWAGERHGDNPGAFGFRFLMRMAYLRWR